MAVSRDGCADTSCIRLTFCSSKIVSMRRISDALRPSPSAGTKPAAQAKEKDHRAELEEMRRRLDDAEKAL